MNLLSGWSAVALAAGLTIPPLVALYFLKLKRRVMPISSTFLWKRAVEDLHVNAPFQRLRSNLLLFLQLLVLLLAAFVLGKPVHQAIQKHEDTLILLIDQSASMAVMEKGDRTRLEIAIEEAKRIVDQMSDNARAMVIAFSDRATVVSSFDSDRAALKRKIESIEQTQSLSRLKEAIALAEAYSQNLIIAGSEAGSDIAPRSAAPPATTLIFSDGRIEDLNTLNIQRLNTENMQLVNVAWRRDNVGITSMSARRNYEQPDILSVFAEIRNFGPEPVSFDVQLYVEDEHRDIQEVRLEPGLKAAPAADETEGGDVGFASATEEPAAPLPGSVASVAFDPFDYGGSGVVEVRMEYHDALEADNRAWAVIDPPRHVKVLLVTAGNLFLERVLPTLPLQVEMMTPDEYETADRETLADGDRSNYDLVIFDGYSTERLYQGSYFFWGSVPVIDDVVMGDPIDNEIIFNWDESHPVLRHVPVANVEVYEWNRLELPSEAQTLIEGESSPVLSYFARQGCQYLICAFRLVVEDEVGDPMMNTFWVTKAHFPVFMYNAIAFLTSSLSATSRVATQPGDPVALARPTGADSLTIRRPNGGRETLTAGKARVVHYARTRRVGVYRVEPAVAGQNSFAVNLFNPAESNVSPSNRMTVGTTTLQATEGAQLVNEPLWPHLLIAALVILLIEWVIYNKRVFV
ncbi:MAG: BatA and WFA domain-containing protein [Phycisphaerae bacterium]|nr:BatA and WFA domain-containing protein [Phycisphaerae bacterium]